MPPGHSADPPRPSPQRLSGAPFAPPGKLRLRRGSPRPPCPGLPLGLRLLRRTGEVMCAVLDPSALAPVLRMPDRDEEAGRGLQMVDALSDVWGWSPVTGRGKAVWAILFCA